MRLRDLLAAPERCDALGRAGRAVAEQHTWDKVLDQLMTYYQSAQRHQTYTRLRANRHVYIRP